MRSGPILLVADEYYASLAAVRGLRAAGYEPWVGATTPDGYAHRSRAAAGVLPLPSPADGDAAFAAAVRAAAAECAARAVLAGTEASVVALSAHEPPAGVAWGVPSLEVVQSATDKARLAALASEVGLRSPASFAADSADVSFPAVVKPMRSAVADAGGTREAPDAVIVRDQAALHDVVSAHPNVEFLVQPYVRGRLLAVAGVARAGDVLCTVHQTAVRTFPRDSGVSAFAETIALDASLDAGIRRLVGALGMTGIWEAQFVQDADGAYLIDFNPRPYGSLQLAVSSGANLPALWADVVLGEPTPETGYRVGRRFRAEMRELGFVAHALRAGDAHAAARVLIPRRRTAHAVLSLRDPSPAVFLLRRIRAQFGG